MELQVTKGDKVATETWVMVGNRQSQISHPKGTALTTLSQSSIPSAFKKTGSSGFLVAENAARPDLPLIGPAFQVG